MLVDNENGTFSIKPSHSFEKQEPVAWMQTYKGEANNIAWTKKEFDEFGNESDYEYFPLYTAPRELSDEEIVNLYKETEADNGGIREFARAILKKASEK
jgi:hypothetical protein